MTKSEALLALDEGKAVRYYTWWWGRFVFLYKDTLVDESGKLVHEDDIFATAENDRGWEIYEPAKHDGGLKL